MTGTPFDDGHLEQAAAELMLRERLDAAVSGLSPDIGRLVSDSAAEGRGAVRRRQIVSGIAAAAVAIVAVGSVSYAAQNDLFGQGDDHATNNNQLEQLVPATPRGLAAAVMAHTDQLGTPLAVGGDDGGVGSQDWQLTAQVAYGPSGGTGVEIDVYATPHLALWPAAACDDPGSQSAMTLCRTLTLSDGTPAYYLEYGAGASISGQHPAMAAAMVVKRDDQVVAAIETVDGGTDLPLDQAALAEIVADPAVGINTTAALNTAGEDIPDFKVGGLITSDSSSGSGTASAPPPSEASRPDRSRGSGDASSAPSN
jgi:hypothetical protein